MSYTFNIKEVVQYLLPNKKNLKKYSWGQNLKLEGLFDLKILNEEEEFEIKNKKEAFDRDVCLKEILAQQLQDSFKNDKKKFYEICNWIIKDWGGIKTGNKKTLNEKINNFLSSDKESMSFDRIASVSKVVSFMYPDKHIIYDSRVASSMNWILLSQSASQKFFPIPEGRNSRLSAFDIQTLIRLKYKNKYAKVESEMNKKNFISDTDKELFFDKSEAYKHLRALIEAVNKELWNDYPERKGKPFYTEMLLFSIADNVVFQDILKGCELQLNDCQILK